MNIWYSNINAFPYPSHDLPLPPDDPIPLRHHAGAFPRPAARRCVASPVLRNCPVSSCDMSYVNPVDPHTCKPGIQPPDSIPAPNARPSYRLMHSYQPGQHNHLAATNQSLMLECPIVP